MYVCICHAVTTDDLRTEVAEGARTPEDVADRCGAGTGCGACVDRVCEVIESLRGHHGRMPVRA